MPQELVEMRGHLIDSLTLPKVLDLIMSRRGRFEIREVEIGRRPRDESRVRLAVEHDDAKELERLLGEAMRHGAEPVERREARLAPAPKNGVFPDEFYATTNLDTSVFLGGRWIEVKDTEMDAGILVSPGRRSARTVKMARAKKGDLIVTGRQGVRVVPAETRRAPEEFEFMASEVSTEKPKGALIAGVAKLMKAERRAKRPILWVCGPAVVHTGAAPLMERLVEAGYAQVLFAGNALAAHDIECALMGTSLGVSLREGTRSRSGHENHLHAINTVRRLGGIRQAVRQGVLKSGIMHACVRRGVRYVLAGSIRDDGPLPEVITDALQAQEAMRALARKPRLAVMVATLLHAVAAGNMLPARARVVCVDIQAGAVTKLMDRGTFQTIGIVTDAQPFLRELLLELGLEP